MQAELYEALAAFDATGCVVQRLGKGNINETYLITVGDGGVRKFILQRISSAVFPEPEKVILNFKTVSEHFTRKRSELKFPVAVARIVTTRSGGIYYRDAYGCYWRAQSYLDDFQPASIGSDKSAHRLGAALATFHRANQDLDLTQLHDPLPGFHKLDNYLRRYEAVSHTIKSSRSDDKLEYCLQMVARYRETVVTLLAGDEAARIPRLVTHGDPKCDNFLFGPDGCEVAIIDLDTVGPGLLSYDLGDCLRSLGNRAGEESREKDKTDIDPDLCRAFAKGYAAMSQYLPELLQEFFFRGLFSVTFELALRFFTDHLQGDTYFLVEKRGQNLDRAVGQFRLLEAICRRAPELRSLLD